MAIADLAAGVRRNVITSVERMTGLEVTEVNITVHDVHLEPTTTAPTASPPEPRPVTDSPELAEQVADVVRTVPGVHDLYGGVLGEVATYLPGRLSSACD